MNFFKLNLNLNLYNIFIYIINSNNCIIIIKYFTHYSRALIQRCPNPSVKNFISLGGQHQGVFGLPNCGMSKPDICHYITRVIKYGAYLQY